MDVVTGDMRIIGVTEDMSYVIYCAEIWPCGRPYGGHFAWIYMQIYANYVY